MKKILVFSTIFFFYFTYCIGQKTELLDSCIKKADTIHARLMRSSGTFQIFSNSINILLDSIRHDIKEYSASKDSSALRIMGATLKNVISDSITVCSLTNIIKPAHTIASQKFLVWAGVYNNINSVPDNDAPGFTQYFGAISVPLPFSKPEGIKDSSTSFCPRIIWLRNLFLQGSWDSKVQQLYYDSINPQNIHSVNRLDLLQYAYLNLTASLNLFTMVLTDQGGRNSKDMWHLYVDAIGGIILDSIKSNNTIPSMLSGLHIGIKTSNAFNTPFSLEAGVDLMWISTRTNILNANLNPQYRSIGSDTAKTYLTTNNQPYLHLDAKLSYYTGSSNASYAYIHFAYYDNVFSPSKIYARNTYIQVQVGYSLDISSILKGLFPNSNSSSINK